MIQRAKVLTPHIFTVLQFAFFFPCFTLLSISFLVSVTEEQTEPGADGWIDTTRGHTHDNDDESESSTYFSDQAARGQKRKKAPFFKFSKKRKGYSNTSSNFKGCVVFVNIASLISYLKYSSFLFVTLLWM